jgi:hypothetical protein
MVTGSGECRKLITFDQLLGEQKNQETRLCSFNQRLLALRREIFGDPDPDPAEKDCAKAETFGYLDRASSNNEGIKIVMDMIETHILALERVVNSEARAKFDAGRPSNR